MASVRADGRVERGNQTRQLILGRAVQIASVEGLEGLSLGRLATELGLSKSGVFALFGSKEGLQLATVRGAVAVFVDHVLRPARSVPPGLGRVWAMCEAWIAYSRERVFRGGCFFYAATAEFDARSGRVHDALASAQTGWVTFVEETIEEARAAGELAGDTDVCQLAFEVIALLELSNAESVLQNNNLGYDKAARAILSRLRSAATGPGLLPPPR
ncbi:MULTISPECIES: TetR/AcrR family transcriptional regulator [Streptomyces]|uniref:TetR/AcrR family transcriptional regulator n=1 Tax=Streptomyces sindenensis TaxID=67363 RepID=A0ABW6EE12_9ACTN|nr:MULTISPECIES: TetR/AcrR family transcriptional regulator [Streptomyces]WGP13541.1 TetR/AcrR family transcriptional regulator [Streptomyces sp. SH5]GGP46478.1 TetR family transcriptional regulator [Streptomyces sindenensis]